MKDEKDFFQIIGDRFKSAIADVETILDHVTDDFANGVERLPSPSVIEANKHLLNIVDTKFYSMEDIEKMIGHKVTQETLSLLVQTRNKFKLKPNITHDSQYNKVICFIGPHSEEILRDNCGNKISDSLGYNMYW